MNKNHFLSGFLMLILGGLLTLAVLFYLPHCHKDGMQCGWMIRAVALIGFEVAVLGLILQFVKNSAVALGLQWANFLNGLVVIALSTVVIGPCASPMMHCHTETQPVVVIWGAIISLVALVHMLLLAKASKRSN